MGHLKRTLLLTFLMVVLGQVAQANTMGTLTLTDCGTPGTLCPAATYSFDVGLTSASLSITINGGLVAGVNNLIGGVDLGFTSATLTNLSGSVSANLAGVAWAFPQTSLNSNGCNMKASAHFVCASVTVNPKSGGAALTTGQTYTWTWTYDAIQASDIFAVGSIHIGANYNPHTGVLVSETGATPPPPLPEPTSLLLIGGGLLGAGMFLRRRSIR